MHLSPTGVIILLNSLFITLLYYLSIILLMYSQRYLSFQLCILQLNQEAKLNIAPLNFYLILSLYVSKVPIEEHENNEFK